MLAFAHRRAMRMPQNRVDCDAGSQHCYAGESSEFSLEIRTTAYFLGFVFPGNPHPDPRTLRYKPFLTPCRRST